MSTIYCDESGFSGPNLYHDSAPHFVYAGIAVEPDEAELIAARIKGFFKRFQGEVKLGRLAESTEGQAALDWLLTEHAHRVKIWYANKKFATAGKFFEYVFEPVLRDNGALFYRNSFHLFIANVLYSGVKLDQKADELLADLQKMIQKRDAAGLKRLLSPQDGLPADRASVFDDIATVALGYRDRIVEEVETIATMDGGVWMMDLTLTALCMVVRALARGGPDLTVLCDTSKPLKAFSDAATAIVQADLSELQERTSWATGTPALLSKPIEVVQSSKNTPGIQLADLFAGMARTILTTPEAKLSKAWSSRIWPIILNESVEANLDFIDLRQPPVYANAIVLKQLAERARRGLDPLRGMDSFYASALQYARNRQ